MPAEVATTRGPTADERDLLDVIDPTGLRYQEVPG
jgi:hypothetical protein